MPPITTFTDVLPLRAIAFQLLFLILAIAIEAAVLNVRLDLGRKVSMQYAASINLFTTVLGWVAFFVAEPLLPEPYRILVIDYVFFGIRSIPPMMIGLGFGIFLVTFLLKLQGIEWLELLLEKSTLPEKKGDESPKFKGRLRQQQTNPIFAPESNRPLAVLWANAFSFTAISIILAIRILVAQPPLPR